MQRLLDLGEGLDEAGEAHQVEKVLRARITDGTYRVGDVLPSPERLCVQLGVRNDSVRRALARLAQAGLTLGISALGTVVTDPDLLRLDPPSRCARDRGRYRPGPCR